jgi:hypothetical protein
MESLLVVVMVIALALAVAMCLFAWRVLRRDRSHSDARVAHLRSLASDEPALEWQPDDTEAADDFEPEITYAAPGLFNAAPPAPARTSWGALIAVVAIFMAVGAGSVYALYGSAPAIAWPTLSAQPAETPLELIALTHRRDPSGEFVVTGLVQNPAAGRATPALSAVVYVFGPDGEYFTSGTAAIEVPVLAPGDQSPFTIRLAGLTKVSRYRLGFRRQDGGAFAHVDRRGEPLAGTTAATVEERP